MPDINEPTEAALELGEKLKVPNVEFDAWVASMPAKHWSKYDLSACRLGWEAALDAERQKREAAERERDDYRRMFDECAVARDASGFLGTVPQCIEHWSRSYEAAEASLAKAIQERDEAREYGKQARLRENAAEDARIHEHDLRVAAEAEVSRLKADIGRKEAALLAFASEENWRQGGAFDPNSPSFCGIGIASAALSNQAGTSK